VTDTGRHRLVAPDSTTTGLISPVETTVHQLLDTTARVAAGLYNATEATTDHGRALAALAYQTYLNLVQLRADLPHPPETQVGTHKQPGDRGMSDWTVAGLVDIDQWGHGPVATAYGKAIHEARRAGHELDPKRALAGFSVAYNVDHAFAENAASGEPPLYTIGDAIAWLRKNPRVMPEAGGAADWFRDFLNDIAIPETGTT
jgi:hypothetical protein